MSASVREKLAEQQAALVAALTGREPAVEGFDVARLKAAAEALASKRRRGVAKAWPTLPRALGKSFSAHFAAFAGASALPACGGAVADGRRFAGWLADQHLLPEAARIEAVHCSLAPDGVAARICPRLKAICLHDRLLIALRLPWFGIRSFSIRLGIF